MLTLALPKGRLFAPVTELLDRGGFAVAGALRANPRRLVLDEGDLRVVVVKDADVPAYVSQGVADAGFVGLDQILEAGVDLLRLRRFSFGQCRMCLLARRDRQVPALTKPFRLATKYPRLAQKLLRQRGLWAEVVPLSGSVELAATLSLAPLVLDLVETGTTLRENGLVIVDTWLAVAPYFVANRASWATGFEVLMTFMHRLGGGHEELSHC